VLKAVNTCTPAMLAKQVSFYRRLSVCVCVSVYTKKDLKTADYNFMQLGRNTCYEASYKWLDFGSFDLDVYLRP